MIYFSLSLLSIKLQASGGGPVAGETFSLGLEVAIRYFPTEAIRGLRTQAARRQKKERTETACAEPAGRNRARALMDLLLTI